jgi:hypothetical protein
MSDTSRPLPSCPACGDRDGVEELGKAIMGRTWFCGGCNLVFDGTTVEWESGRLGNASLPKWRKTVESRATKTSPPPPDDDYERQKAKNAAQMALIRLRLTSRPRNSLDEPFWAAQHWNISFGRPLHPEVVELLAEMAATDGAQPGGGSLAHYLAMRVPDAEEGPLEPEF